MDTVLLPDGYFGDTESFFITPLEVWNDGTCKLQCSDPKKPQVIKWVRTIELDIAVKKGYV